ncbi:MAG: hypothetical protein RL007_1125 [Bacteroidota bacterium]|jgi:hypothetical protein
MIMRYLSFTFLFLLSITTVFSQTPVQTIRGTIVDNQSKSTLPGVLVILQDTGAASKSTTTDINGTFRFDQVPIGRHTLVFRFMGYTERSATVILTSGKEVVLNIEMEESVNTVNEVVITDQNQKSKPLNDMATVSSRSFTIEETQRYAGSLGDPSRMAANYAGISGAQDSRNDVVIRGNSPMGLLWKLNGIDIPNPNHFGSFGSTGGPVSILNNNVLSNSDFMTSAFPAEYGNALSGVFDLRMRNGNNEKYEFMGQVGFNGFEFGAEGPISKKRGSSFMINYRYSTLELFSKIGVEFGTGVAVPKYQDLSFRMNFPTEKAGDFSIWGIGGLSYIELLDSETDTTKLDLYTLGGFDTYYGTRMGVIGFSHMYSVNASTYSRLNVGVTGAQNYVQVDSIGWSDMSFWPNYGSDFHQIKVNVNYALVKKFNAKNTLKSGFQGESFSVMLRDSTAINPTTFRLIRDVEDQSMLIQAYSQWQHRFTGKLTLNLGIHGQYLHLSESWAVEPRMGFKWQINEKNSLSIGSGLHSQIQPIFIYYNQTLLPNGQYALTNTNVDYSKAFHNVIAWDWNFAPQMRIKAEVYYQYLYNIPGLERASIYSALNDGADFGSPGIDSLVNNGTGRNLGFEFTLEKFYSKGYYFLATASLYQAFFTPSDGIERQSAFSGNYVFNVLGGKEFKFGPKHTLSFDLKTNAAGGKRYIPIDLTASNAAGMAVYDYSKAYDQRYSGYFRIDFKIGYIFNMKHVTQQWSIELLNLTNNKNMFTQDYDKTNNTIKTTYQTGFLLIPSYRITF